jgi:cell wall-associated NlpC family hydrolase
MDLTRYIGLPYVFKGESFKGVDCYGLCRLFYRFEFEEELPDYGHLYTDGDGEAIGLAVLNNRAKGRWVMGPDPVPYSIATFRVKGLPIHCGIVLQNRRDFLHAFKGRMSAIEPLDAISWASRLEGYSVWTR